MRNYIRTSREQRRKSGSKYPDDNLLPNQAFQNNCHRRLSGYAADGSQYLSPTYDNATRRASLPAYTSGSTCVSEKAYSSDWERSGTKRLRRFHTITGDSFSRRFYIVVCILGGVLTIALVFSMYKLILVWNEKEV